MVDIPETRDQYVCRPTFSCCVCRQTEVANLACSRSENFGRNEFAERKLRDLSIDKLSVRRQEATTEEPHSRISDCTSRTLGSSSQPEPIGLLARLSGNMGADEQIDYKGHTEKNFASQNCIESGASPYQKSSVRLSRQILSICSGLSVP